MRRILLIAGLAVAALGTVSSTASATAPTCDQARNYAIFQEYNEAQFIGGSRGFTITNPHALAFCNRETANNRTQVQWRYSGRNFGGGGDPENIDMDAYVYGSFVACSGQPVHNYDLGNVNYAYYRSDGIIDGGTYATPCE